MTERSAQSDESATAVDDSGVDDLQAAGMVARYVDLRDVHLRRLNAELTCTAQELLGSDCAWEVSAPTAQWEYDEHSSMLSVNVAIDVAAVGAKTTETTKGELKRVTPKSLLTLSVELVLQYELRTEAPPDDLRELLFDAFAGLNGVYNAYPYLREHVQSTIGRMGLPPLVIPVFRVPRRDDASSSEEP